MPEPIVFPTVKNEIRLRASYPIIMGEPNQVSSKADQRGIEQQFIDRGIQKELGLKCRPIGPNARGWPQYAWYLSFYVHPGMRREVPVKYEDTPALVDYLHALAVGIAPADQLHRRLDPWVRVHTFGFGGVFATGAEVVRHLAHGGLDWPTASKNLAAYGIEAVGAIPQEGL